MNITVASSAKCMIFKVEFKVSEYFLVWVRSLWNIFSNLGKNVDWYADRWLGFHFHSMFSPTEVIIYHQIFSLSSLFTCLSLLAFLVIYLHWNLRFVEIIFLFTLSTFLLHFWHWGITVSVIWFSCIFYFLFWNCRYVGICKGSIERACVLFPQFPPLVTPSMTIVQYQNQERDIGTTCVYSFLSFCLMCRFMQLSQQSRYRTIPSLQRSLI